MRFGLAFAVLLSLAACAAAQTGVAAGGLEAVASGTGVHVRWTPDGAGDAVVLVASHATADGGQVVDWVRQLSANGTQAVEVLLEDLPADDLRVDAWDPAAWPAEAVSGATTLVEPLPAGAEAEHSVEVEAPSREAVRSFHAYPVSDERADERDAHIAVTPGGAVVATWSFLDYGPLMDCAVRVAASLDGGHTFSAPVEVMRRPTTDLQRPCEIVQHWASAPLASGLVAIVWDDAEDDAPARMVLYDPTTGSLLPGPVPLPEVRFLNRAAAVPDGLGGFLLAAGTGIDGTVKVWRVAADGTAVPVAEAPGGSSYSFFGTTNGLGDVAFVWVDYVGGYRVWAMRSSDGGLTFAPAEQVALPPSKQVDLGEPHLSASGTLHLAFEDAVEGTATYVRVPAEGPTTALPLCGEAGASVLPGCDRAQYPLVAASGDRVWVLFERWEDDAYGTRDGILHVAAESADDGRAFAPPYLLRDRVGEALSAPHGTAVFGDGRPLLYGAFFFGPPEAPVARHAVVPFFDPGAPPALLLNATASVAVPAPAAEPLEFERLATDGASLEVRVRNLGGGTWRDVAVEAVDAATGETVGRIDLPGVAPGGRVEGLLPGSLPAGSSGDVEVRVTVAGSLLGRAATALPVYPQEPSTLPSVSASATDDASLQPSEPRGTPAAPAAVAALGLAAAALARRRAGAR